MADSCGSNKPVLIWSIVLSLGFFGWIFSIIAVASCSFLTDNPTGELTLGIFKHNFAGCDSYGDDCYVSSYCTAYSTGPIDGAHGASQAFGVMAVLFSGINFVILFSGLFWKEPNWLHRTIAGFYIFNFISQLLTLLFVKSLNDLVGVSGLWVLSAGGVLAILAALFFLPCAVLMFVYPPPERKIIGACKAEQQAVGPKATGPHQFVVNPDGTFVATNEVTAPNQQKPDGQQQPGMMPQQFISVNPDGTTNVETAGGFTNEGMPQPPPLPPMGSGEYEETTYERLNPDGTKTVTTVVTYPDGSKTVTETEVAAESSGDVAMPQTPALADTNVETAGGFTNEGMPPPPPPPPMGSNECQETTYERLNPDGTKSVFTVVAYPDGSKTVTETAAAAEPSGGVAMPQTPAGADLPPPIYPPSAARRGASRMPTKMPTVKPAPTVEIPVEPVASVPIVEAKKAPMQKSMPPGKMEWETK